MIQKIQRQRETDVTAATHSQGKEERLEPVHMWACVLGE